MEKGFDANPYVAREFYGPLALFTTQPVPLHMDAYQHPENSSKMARLNVKSFGNSEEVKESIASMQQLLQRFDAIGIPHVNPEYFNTSVDTDRPSIGMVVDIVPGAIGIDEIIERGEVTDKEFFEIDTLACKLATYLIDVVQQGGYLSTEALYLGQFVYAPGAAPGKQCVLVDVEPVSCCFQQPHEAMDDVDLIALMLCEDLANLQRSHPDLPLKAWDIACRARIVANTPPKDFGVTELSVI